MKFEIKIAGKSYDVEARTLHEVAGNILFALKNDEPKFVAGMMRKLPEYPGVGEQGGGVLTYLVKAKADLVVRDAPIHLKRWVAFEQRQAIKWEPDPEAAAPAAPPAP